MNNSKKSTCINNSASAEIDFSIFSMLIKANTDVRQKDVFGRNPLFYLFINENGETKEKFNSSNLTEQQRCP